MLKVDLSNVWGDLSLPDLLATEQEVFAAHKTLAEGRGPGNDFLGWLELPTFEETEELQRIRRAAERIRADSDVFVVVGIGGGTICDLCKYATYYFEHENPLPVVIVQTALSVNAFSDDSSVMLMSHLVDMASRVRKTGICYHGTQVAVSGIISEIIWDWLLTEFDPKSADLEKCYPTLEEMEPKVKAAFDWLDDTHSAAEECWADYQKKLNRWHAHKAEFKAFLENFDAFKATVAPWVKKPEYVVDCMHKATIADEPGNQ